MLVRKKPSKIKPKYPTRHELPMPDMSGFIIGVDPSTNGFYYTILQPQEQRLRYVESALFQGTLREIASHANFINCVNRGALWCIERPNVFINKAAFLNVLALTRVSTALTMTLINFQTVNSNSTGGTLHGGWRPFLHNVRKPVGTWDALAKQFCESEIIDFPTRKITSHERDAACIAATAYYASVLHAHPDLALTIAGIKQGF